MIARIKNIKKDGPLPSGVRRECSHCGFNFADDIYLYHGVTLCGDCRYIARHGKTPPRVATTSCDISDHDWVYHGGNEVRFDQEWWEDQIGAREASQ